MAGEQFVKLCFDEKESTLKEYFDENTSTEVGERLRSLISDGANRDALFEIWRWDKWIILDKQNMMT